MFLAWGLDIFRIGLKLQSRSASLDWSQLPAGSYFVALFFETWILFLDSYYIFVVMGGGGMGEEASFWIPSVAPYSLGSISDHMDP